MPEQVRSTRDELAARIAAEARALGGKRKSPGPGSVRSVLRWLWIRDPEEEAGVTRDELVEFGRGRYDRELTERLAAISADLPRPVETVSLALILAAIADRRR